MSSVDVLKAKEFFDQIREIELIIDKEIFENLKTYIENDFDCFGSLVDDKIKRIFECDKCIFKLKNSIYKSVSFLRCYVWATNSNISSSSFLKDMYGQNDENFETMKKNFVLDLYKHYKVFFEGDDNE